MFAGESESSQSRNGKLQETIKEESQE